MSEKDNNTSQQQETISQNIFVKPTMSTESRGEDSKSIEMRLGTYTKNDNK